LGGSAAVTWALVRLLRYGESGLLVELESSALVSAAYRVLRGAVDGGALAGVDEVVPAARTVLIRGDPPRDEVTRLLDELSTEEPDRAGRAELVIPVRYDGADLELVADTAKLSVAEVVELHTAAEYTVAFCGFAPGFGYLTGLPEQLHQARLDDARPKVPAGSVGVAGEFSAVYPRSSPGGWRLIGRTELVMFDPSADPPARLAPGDRVRFERVR
jgi:KipI family sensor histidine kinase inhibitor